MPANGGGAAIGLVGVWMERATPPFQTVRTCDAWPGMLPSGRGPHRNPPRLPHSPSTTPPRGFVRWRRGRREGPGGGRGKCLVDAGTSTGSWPSHGSVGTLAVLLELRPCPVQQRRPHAPGDGRGSRGRAHRPSPSLLLVFVGRARFRGKKAPRASFCPLAGKREKS